MERKSKTRFGSQSKLSTLGPGLFEVQSKIGLAINGTGNIWEGGGGEQALSEKSRVSCRVLPRLQNGRRPPSLPAGSSLNNKIEGRVKGKNIVLP